MKWTLTLLCLILAFTAPCEAGEIRAKLDTSVRLDAQSGKDSRWQYRIRFYPQFKLNNNLSFNAFVNTGDSFASSYNTLDDSSADYFYLRRLYLRHQQGQGKTELGVIPTYKGPVSSTGLSKDGWITGARQVFAVNPHSQLEFVIGELDHLDKPSAFQSVHKLNYFEMEYSSALSQRTSFEFSVERMLEANFMRAELRHNLTSEQQYALELIHRLDTDNVKVVLSIEHSLTLFNHQAWLFAYYSYVDGRFGPRAELTEDFLDTGHAVSTELKGAVGFASALQWFAKLEHYQRSQTSRFQVGLQYKFSS